MLRLSVALCTYNGAEFLREQLDSIASQTRHPDEVVVRDDGSVDGTVGVLEEFAAEAPFPVRLLPSGVNLGYVKNFEAVIAACTGDLIALSDQDDVWLPHKLATLEKALGSDERALLAFSDAALVGSGLEPLGQTVWERVGLDARAKAGFERGGADSPVLRGLYVTGATVCFRASLVELALPIDLPHWHDGWLTLAAAAYGRVVAVDEPLVLYRQHDRNVLGAKPRAGQLKRTLAVVRMAVEGKRAARLHLSNVAQYTESALQRFSDSPAPGFRERLVFRAAHAASRLEMFDHSLPRRIVPVLGRLVSGRYHRYDTGGGAALYDLLH